MRGITTTATPTIADVLRSLSWPGKFDAPDVPDDVVIALGGVVRVEDDALVFPNGWVLPMAQRMNPKKHDQLVRAIRHALELVRAQVTQG